MVVKGLKSRQAKLKIGAILSNNNYKLTSTYIDNLKERIQSMIIEELDRIRTKDGRIGTVLAKWFDTNGLEIEFDDTAPQTETIDISDVSEVINR